MNSETLTSGYESPLRDAQKEETRRRIVDAAGQLMADASLGGLSYAAIAREAGVQERTVYRHFPTKDDLIDALWGWLDPSIGFQSFPQTEDELVAFPPRVFPAFDDNENMMRAMWTTPQGREFRLKVNERRQAAIRRSVSDATKDLPAEEAAAITAAAQLLYSGAAWLTMKDYWGFSGAQSGEASAFVLKLLLDAARQRAAETKGAAGQRDKDGPNP